MYDHTNVIVYSIIITVLTIAVTYLFASGVIRKFKFSKDKWLEIEGRTIISQSSSSVLHFTRLLDEIESECKLAIFNCITSKFTDDYKKMLDTIRKLLIGNIMRDVMVNGLTSFINNLSTYDDWTDTQTQAVTTCLVYNLSIMVESKLEIYRQILPDSTNKAFTEAVIKKNEVYKVYLHKQAERIGLDSSTHNEANV